MKFHCTGAILIKFAHTRAATSFASLKRIICLSFVPTQKRPQRYRSSLRSSVRLLKIKQFRLVFLK